MILERYTETSACTIHPAATTEDFAVARADQARRGSPGKPPLGTWFSVPGKGIDWPEWCRGESFNLNRLRYRHTFDLDLGGVLNIDTLSALDEFHREYIPQAPPSDFETNWLAFRAAASFDVDWPRLASRVGGIVIAPYQWQRRTDYLWYYTWDCASACVWDPRLLTFVSSERIDQG